jgi:uncharacterized membrane protein YgcG
MRSKSFNWQLLVCLVMALLPVVFGVRCAFSQDFFIGEVLGMDTKRGEISLAPLATNDVSTGSGHEEVVRIEVSQEFLLRRRGKSRFFPGCVEVGKTIRLWGQDLRASRGVFVVTEIRGCRGGGCSDPTGVRLRLLEGRRGMSKEHGSGESGSQRGVAGQSGSGGGHGNGSGGNGGNGGGGGGGGR